MNKIQFNIIKIAKSTYLHAFLLPTILFALALYFNDVYPINPSGNRSILVIDFGYQYFPFVYEFAHRLREGGSLFWSWNLGGGVNYLFHYAYYLTSPFNLLASLFSPAILREVLMVFVVLKIGLAGMTMAIYLNYKAKRNDSLLPIFASIYALSGWTLAYYHNIMWLDVFYITPLVVLGAKRLILEKKCVFYVLMTAFALFLNFHIAFMLALFVILYFLASAFIYYKSMKEFLTGFLYLAVSSFIAIGLMGWLLIPALAGIMNMYRETMTTFPEARWFGPLYILLSGFMGFAQQSLFNFRGEGDANIYSGLLPVMLFLVFILSKRVSGREKIAYGAFVLFLLASLNHSHLHFIWHGFSFTFGFPGRFSFLLSFLLVSIAYKMYLTMIESEISQKNLLSLLGVLIILFVSHFSWQENRFLMWNYAMVALYFGIFYVWYKAGQQNLQTVIKPLKYGLFILVSVELMFTAYFSIDSWGTYHHPIRVYDEVNEIASHMSEGFFRTEFTRQGVTNQTFANSSSNINQVAIFSSSMNGATGRYMRDLGLPSNLHASRYLFFETSPLTNAFLNVRYLIDMDNNPADEGFFFERISQVGDVALLKNNFELPIGFMTSGDLRYWQGNPDPMQLFESQNKLFSLATGIEEELFQIFMVSYYSEDGIFRFDLGMPYQGDLFLVSTLGANARIYEYPTLLRFIPIRYPAIHYLGTFIEGTHVRLGFHMGEVRGEREIQVAILNRDVFVRGYEILNQETLDITEFSDTHLRGVINVSQSGLLYTSIPSDNGNWRAFVDGNRVDVTLINDAMVAIELDPGIHIVEFRYVNIPFRYGVVVGLLALAAVAVIMWRVPELIVGHKSQIVQKKKIIK